MAISTGMKIGIASGFMARREKIAEDQKEETKDFGKATDASIKTANQILRVESERDAAEIVEGKGILQHEVLAPILKGKNISDDMIRKVGIEAQALKKAGSSVKSIALALQKRIANETIKLEETQAKEQRDEQLQQALVNNAKENNTSNKVATALAQAFSGSARGEAARDLIRQRITPDQQEVMDRGNTYKERKPSLGLSPKKMLTLTEQKAMRKMAIEQIAGGDTEVDYNQDGTVKPGTGSEATTQKIQISAALINADKNQYQVEDVPKILQSLQDLEESGYDLNKSNTSNILKDVRRRGATNVMAELLNNEHATQKSKKPVSPVAGTVNKNEKTEDSDKLTQLADQAKNIRENGKKKAKAIKGEEPGELSEVWEMDGRNYRITSKNSKVIKVDPI
tara:strand:+ start:2359 stop:3549 length:1191 start_codon:yes stop_codon:yes gene_type:complete